MRTHIQQYEDTYIAGYRGARLYHVSLGTAIYVYICVLTLLYMCVLVLIYMCPLAAVRGSLTSHTVIYVSSYCYICVLILLYICPLPYMCPHTAIYLSSCSGAGVSDVSVGCEGFGASVDVLCGDRCSRGSPCHCRSRALPHTGSLKPLISLNPKP